MKPELSEEKLTGVFIIALCINILNYTQISLYTIIFILIQKLIIKLHKHLHLDCSRRAY